MALKRHHKIMISGAGLIIVLSLIFIGILLNAILTRQNLNYNSLDNKIGNYQIETRMKLDKLTQDLSQTKEGLIQTQDGLRSLGSRLSSINNKFDLLKASVDSDFSGIINDSINSVVSVRTDVAQGTGFIINKDGYVVTNAHVLAGGKVIQVVLYNNNVLPAELVGYDPTLDIALLRIHGVYKKLELADSDKIIPGEKVVAIGNPLGLQFSVSEGIISAIHRPGLTNKNIYIQTDASLNPGNSGGPLIDKEGKVIGINNFKIKNGENLGFALESNYIKLSVNEISQKAINKTLIK